MADSRTDGSCIRTSISKIPYIGFRIAYRILEYGIEGNASRRIIGASVDGSLQPCRHTGEIKGDLDRCQVAAIPAGPVPGRPYSRCRGERFGGIAIAIGADGLVDDAKLIIPAGASIHMFTDAAAVVVLSVKGCVQQCGCVLLDDDEIKIPVIRLLFDSISCYGHADSACQTIGICLLANDPPTPSGHIHVLATVYQECYGRNIRQPAAGIAKCSGEDKSGKIILQLGHELFGVLVDELDIGCRRPYPIGRPHDVGNSFLIERYPVYSIGGSSTKIAGLALPGTVRRDHSDKSVALSSSIAGLEHTTLVPRKVPAGGSTGNINISRQGVGL